MKNLTITSGRSSFVARMISISVVAGLLSGLWISSASAAESPKMNQPGRCVVTTSFNDDGSIATSKSCEYTHAEWIAIQRKAANDKRTAGK